MVWNGNTKAERHLEQAATQQNLCQNHQRHRLQSWVPYSWQQFFPLIFTEFGFDQQGSTEADNKFLTCLQTYLVGRDMDWGLWALQGGYYLREDQVQLEETFGVMDTYWQHLRFPNFTQMFQLLQRKNQDDSTCLDDPRSQWFHFVPTNL
ncbi:hypothetical protein K1719_018611 [Acacia pycnantha]|nr:hypothetical protein K1719_018611 [Acacia pycnantha]